MQRVELVAVEMLASSDGVQVESFHIFQDDKFIPRRMTRELAVDTSSAQECYHAGACATVPFIWESQPGTPKHRLRQTPLQPLTPPPSFFSKSAATPPSKENASNILTRKVMFPKLSFLRSHRAIRLSTSAEASPQSLSTSPSSWSSSSPTVLSSPITPLCDYYYSRRYGFIFEAEDEKAYFRPSSSSSSYNCSPFQCFGSEKCSRRYNARRTGGRYSSIFRRFIGISTP